MRWRPQQVESLRARYVIVLVGALLVTLPMLPLREHISILNEALVYLLFVVVVSAEWGLGPGIVASIVVNLLLDFFFVPPIYGLAPYKYEDVIALAGFLAATAAVGSVLAHLREKEEDAALRQRESQLLYELSTLVISDVGSISALQTICQRLKFALSAQLVDVFVPGPDGWTPLAGYGAPRPIPPESELHAAVSSARSRKRGMLRLVDNHARQANGTETRVIPLRVGTELQGAMRVVAAHDLEEPSTAGRLCTAFAQVAALALYHEKLLAKAASAMAFEQADELKSALLAAVSHELRTPLAGIKAAATSLLDVKTEWLPNQRQEFLTSINVETDRLTRLVSDLLDLSRIEGGAITPRRDWYDLREFLETVLQRAALITATHVVDIEIDGSDGDAYFDYVQMGQVVSNLLENAAKFSAASSTITVIGRVLHSHAEIVVADEGHGIAEEDRPHVFERFYRGRGSAGIPGSGLGLTISSGIVRAHNGELTIETGSGPGAQFRVSLPQTRQGGGSGNEDIAQSAS